MDLMLLKPDKQGGQLIENYDSLVWAERYTGTGDFQLVTGDIEGFMEKMPEGQLVTLRESTVPMIVETHQIDRKKNAGAKLIIRGREYTSILDRRVSVHSVLPGLTEWSVVAKTPSDVAHFIMVKICEEGIADAADIFPSSEVVFVTPDDYLQSTGPNRQFSVARGNLLDTITNLLSIEAPADITTNPDTPKVMQHGIRAVRPDETASVIGIEIYSGVDRSATVFFDATRDLLDDGTYLFSKVGSANVSYGLGQTIASKMSFEGVPPTGLERRVIFHETQTSNAEALIEEQSAHLSQAHETALFNGTVNHDLSPYVYGVDFHLGDIVRTVGDYGLDERARVTEYIRTEDATGEKSAPTLSAIPSYL